MNPNEVIILNKEEYAKEVPSLLEFNQICRLCMLLITETESLKSIHDEHFNMSIKSLLEIYTLLKIPDKEEDDRLPPNICLDCANFLIEMHTFRSRCQVSNDFLLKISKQLKQEQEDEETTEQIPPQLLPFENISMQLCDVKFGCLECKDCNVVLDDTTFFAHSCKAPKPKAKTMGRLALCSVCNKVVNSRRLSTHMHTHSKSKPHKCNYCGYSSLYRNNLERHVLQHTGIKPYMCSVCGKSFIQLTELQAHEKRHIKQSGAGGVPKKETRICKPRQGRICQYCRYGFVTQALLDEHIAVAHNNGKFSVQDESKKTMYKCQHTGCKETFEYEYDLTKHTRTHTNAMPYTCSVCDRTFKMRSCLFTDLAAHIGEKLYSCKYCSKMFGRPLALLVHERIHTGTKKYVCNTCGKAFVQGQQLKYHQITHTGEKRYVCDTCGTAFTTNGSLTVHKRIHTGEMPYKCCVCSQEFRDSSNKRKHQQKAHSQLEVQQALASLKEETE